MPATHRPLRGPRWPLRFDVLEDRSVPAVTFQFDYSLDSSGFFADPAHRQALEQAGGDLTSRLGSTPAAITPGGANSWTAIFQHPVTGNETVRSGFAVPAGTLIVFAGGMEMSGAAAGLGGPGGYRVGGSSAWQNTIANRGVPGVGTWGGSISFDPNQNWYFGTDPNGVGSQTDFYSIAVHELAHLLGYGTTEAFDTLATGSTFNGAKATAVNGGTPPRLSSDGAHWAQGTRSNGESVSLQPVMEFGRRVPFTDLDYAALQDLGWSVATTVPTPTPTVPVAPATPNWDPVPGDAAAGRLLAVSGPTDGTVQAYTGDANGRLVPVGPAIRPFGSYGGSVRSATGDVNGDGVTDLIVATGPGGGSIVRVLDGRTFADLANPPYQAFESAFAGGVYLAAGDFDNDGRDEVVITPDQGGGPRVQILTLVNGTLQVTADFFGINDPTFRGGARTAVGDMNRDGTPELVVAAGFGGGPRVSVIDGTTVLSPLGRVGIGGDFFAFEPGLRNGAFVAVADLDGDGYGDLTFGAGPGGGPRVLTLSGYTITTAGAATALALPMANTFAGNAEQRGGVRVTAKDLDGDGQSEILTGDGSGGELRVYQTVTGGLTPVTFLNPFASATPDGVYVG